ncbi:MAG: peptidoglycan-binding lipoprotein, OmpA family [Deltaproteobacteria bacterium]|nr:peptidoglycan-binding lipoprotein, OmpA family [Deltaproteobacteria bacterium]
MKNRNLILVLTILVAAAFAAGCGQLRPLTKGETDQANAISGKIADAEKRDAKACAPKELANAQADLDQARYEATQTWEVSKTYFDRSEKSTEVLLAKVKECEEKKLVPTCGLVAEPETIAPGKCATLKWKGENVKKIVWGSDETDKKAIEAPMTGSKEVCPKETTDYQMSCVGKWSTNYEAASVKVEEPPPPPPPVVVPAPVPVAPPKAKEATLRVNFDTAKYTIRPADLAELQKGVQFIKDNPSAKIHIVGYTDSRGGDKYNQKLSEQRAETVKKYLQGEVSIPAENITSEGKGEADPVGDNKTADGQFQNRRVVLTIK